jgi:maltooligosyltrehalose synthase
MNTLDKQQELLSTKSQMAIDDLRAVVRILLSLKTKLARDNRQSEDRTLLLESAREIEAFIVLLTRYKLYPTIQS